jgi:ParB-like chromosome segregation protein Spo0J
MPKTQPTPWQSRITRYGEEPPDQLLANPINWRTHPKNQQATLSGVLAEVGIVQNVIVNERTGHVVDGHLRVSLAMREGQPTVPITYVDLSEAEEALILATLDPIAAMAGTDADNLAALLDQTSTTNADVMAMLSELAEREGVVSHESERPEIAPQVKPHRTIRSKNGLNFIACNAWDKEAHHDSRRSALDLKRAMDPYLIETMAADISSAAIDVLGNMTGWVVAPPAPGRSANEGRAYFAGSVADSVANTTGATKVDAFGSRDGSYRWGQKTAKAGRTPPSSTIDTTAPMLIIDDIATTGATISEALTIARAENVCAIGIVWVYESI